MILELLQLGPSPADPLKGYVQVASIASAIIAVGTVLLTRTLPWLWAKLQSRSVQHGIGAEYSLVGIERSIRYYIRPDCQDIDPAGGDEPRLVYGVRTPLFDALDDILNRRTEFRYLMLLADSGMGKTSALINYYTRHNKKIVKPYRLVMIPLSIPDADKRIREVERQSETVLLLDALDEDTLAIVDHRERVRLLLELTRDFQKVVISCRTQFFSRDEEIPSRTGILKAGARAAGEKGEYEFHKLYLSPFSDRQVTRYLRKLYPIWRLRSRRDAMRMARSISHLSARPMLLAHIDDVIKSNRRVTTSAELYEEMVAAWIAREDALVRGKGQLATFSEKLATDIYLERQRRGAERISGEELSLLARSWDIQLEDWKLSGRSLLNRDGDGNYKFAHRSIMEYLFVLEFKKGDVRCLNSDWTDQMRKFYLEIVFGAGKEVVADYRTGEILCSRITEEGLENRIAKAAFIELDCSTSAFNRMRKLWSLLFNDAAFIPLVRNMPAVDLEFVGNPRGLGFEDFVRQSLLKRRPNMQTTPLGWFSSEVTTLDEGIYLTQIGTVWPVVDVSPVHPEEYRTLNAALPVGNCEYLLFFLSGSLVGCRTVASASTAARLFLSVVPDRHKVTLGDPGWV